jgi:hypothetical protein
MNTLKLKNQIIGGVKNVKRDPFYIRTVIGATAYNRFYSVLI